MKALRLTKIMLFCVFLIVNLGAGYASWQYYRHYCKSERIKFLELKAITQENVHERIRLTWHAAITNTINHTKTVLSHSRKNISKSLKIIEASQPFIERAFYIDQKTIFLAQWQKFRISKQVEHLSLGLSEDPRFRKAEIYEYQHNNFRRAIGIYEKFWLENPDNLNATYALARCLFKDTQFDRAEKLYRQIFRQNPDLKTQGDVPLAVTSGFQLLRIYQMQGNTTDAIKFAYHLYSDFLDEKWELTRQENRFFKQKIKTAIEPLLITKKDKRLFRRLYVKERQLAKFKDYIRFISRRIIPFIEARPINYYSIYFLQEKKDNSFLLIIPHFNGHIVLETNFNSFITNTMEKFMKTLADDQSLGLKLYDSENVLINANTQEGETATFSLSTHFPELKLDIIYPYNPEHQLNQRLARVQIYFIVGYSLFFLFLALIFFVLIKQINFAETKSDFVSHVSHELKTPLTSLRMFSEILITHKKLPSKKRQQYYDIMSQESIRLSRLIENLLDISRIEKKKSQFYFKKDALDETVMIAVDIFKNALGKQEYKLDVKLKSHAMVMHDKDAVIQMVLNLLDNARKFSEEGSRLKIETAKSDHKVILRVSDQGMGMSKQEIRKVFKKFYQVKKTYEEKFKGVGLGLAIVKNIIHAHNGKIYIFSEKNKGTQVELRFPMIKK